MVKYSTSRTFGGRNYYLLSATASKREAEESKRRAKIQGSLARIVPIKHDGKPAYLVYVFRRGTNPKGQRKADRLNRFGR